MERTAVTSSTRARTGYAPTSMTLEVEFIKGGIYQYFDVPEAVHQEFMAAGSHGKYLHANIKGVYRFAKV